jgi:hypothetical protein
MVNHQSGGTVLTVGTVHLAVIAAKADIQRAILRPWQPWALAFAGQQKWRAGVSDLPEEPRRP